MNSDLARTVLAGIITAMESGDLPPWKKSWTSSIGDTPKNAVTGKAYSGANRFLLMIASLRHGDSRYIGMKQANKLGGSIKAGSKSIPIVIPIFKKVEHVGNVGNLGDLEPKEKLVGFSLARVFSVRDCIGLDPKKIVALPAPKMNHNPIQAAEDFIKLKPIKIVNGPAPCYIPSLDEIRIPTIGDCDSPEAYYAAAYHEIGHATGHASRCNREGITNPTKFGSSLYSEEELVAEIFACFGRQETGINGEAQLKESASYLKGWLEVLKAEPSMLLRAANASEKALRFWKGTEVKADESAEIAA